MKSVKLYTASELKELFPSSYLYAYKKYQEDNNEIFWQDETMESLKGTFKYANVTLNDWEISDCSPSWVKFTIPTFWSDLEQEDLLVDDYTGKIAMKWLKETFDIKKAKRVSYINYEGKKASRWDLFKEDGKPWDGEFTGYCGDYDFINSLFEDIGKNNCTLYEAFDNLASVAGKLFEAEYEYQMSEEFFIEHTEMNDWYFSESGIRVE
jgi:hypothetical protein